MERYDSLNLVDGELGLSLSLQKKQKQDKYSQRVVTSSPGNRKARVSVRARCDTPTVSSIIYISDLRLNLEKCNIKLYKILCICICVDE